ncbi:MAG: PDZ domain-containing protein [Gemmataceae bacterium]
MRTTLTAFFLLGCLAGVAYPQAKKNPFIDPTARDEKKQENKEDKKPTSPPGKSKNPFTDPDTKVEEVKPKPVEEDKTVDLEESKGPIIVPMTRLPSGHFLVKVKLNGKGPYQLVFDTGAPLMLLNTKIAKEGKVSKGGGFSLLNGMNPEIINSLEVGSARAVKVPAMVMDHPTVAAISDAFESDFGKIEGIVGFPFFAKFATTVDYQKGELRLEPNGYKPGDFLKDMTTRLSAMSGPQPTPVLAPAGAWGMTVAKKSSDENAGVNVTAVLVGSPADKAGVKVGDRLLTLDGRWTDSLADTFRATGFVKPGRTVELELMRDGKAVRLKCTPVRGQ